jgi:hypothetical protein
LKAIDFDAVQRVIYQLSRIQLRPLVNSSSVSGANR